MVSFFVWSACRRGVFVGVIRLLMWTVCEHCQFVDVSFLALSACPFAGVVSLLMWSVCIHVNLLMLSVYWYS